MSKQLVLFAPSPALPSAPFTRWSRKIHEVRICTRCAREIVTRRTATGELLREFVSPTGQCWGCTHTY
jgi:hypothetical protein